MRSTFATLTTAVGICLAGPANASMQADDRAAGAATLVESGYAPVNGLNMYYEIHGSGPPLVLLHGTLSAIGTSFGDLIPFLAATRRVVAIEQQAHGRTADVDRPLSYEQMADDTNALLRYLGIERADILGYSMGGIIAMQMALLYPDRVRKLLLASAVSSTDGFDPGGFAAIEDLKAADWIGSPFHEEYARIAPSPDVHTLIHKAKEVVTGFRGWTADDIRSIQAPTLIVIGDAGIVRPEHAVEMFRLFCSDTDGGSVERPPNTQLAVLPGMTHVEFMHRTELLVPMIVPFLDAPMPEGS